MKATTVVGILVIGGAAVAGGWFAMQTSVDPGVPTIRDVVPDDVLFYAECENLAGTLTQMKTQPSWIDLEASPLLQDDDLGLKPFLDTLKQLSAKVEYDLNEQNLMKLLGREVGFAVRPRPAGSGMQMALVSRLDVAALSKDLLSGEINPKALQDELESRAAKAEFSQIATEMLGRYELTSLTRGESSYHVVLMEDVLVVADDPAFARNMVTTRNGTTASLATSTAFQADLAKLPAGATMFDWTNLDLARSQRQAMSALWDSKTVGGAPSFPFDTVLDATSQCPSIARSWSIPDGDLYGVSWQYTRSAADLFDDDLRGDVGVVASNAHTVYVELRDMADLGPAWDASDAKKRLENSRLGDWLEEFGDNPVAKMKDTVDALPGPMGGGFGRMLDDVPVEGSLAFPMRLGMSVMQQQMERFFEGSASMGVEVFGVGERPPVGVDASVRLGIEGRAAVMSLFEVLGDDEDAPGTWTEPLNGRAVMKIGELRDKPQVHAVLAGDLLLLSTGRDRLRAILERLEGRQDAEPARPTALLDQASEKRHLGVYVSNERLLDGFAGAGDAFPDQLLEMMAGPADQAMTVNVAAAFGNVTFEQLATFHDAGPSGKWAKIVEQGDWASAPMAQKGTILYSVLHWNVAELYEMLRGIEMLELHRAELDVDEFLGLSLRNELLPSFGSEWSMSVIGNHERIENGPPPFPELVLQVRVKDDGPVQRTLGRLTDQLVVEAEKGAGSGRGPTLARHTLDTGAMVVLGLGRGGPPIRPAYGMIDDFLTVTTSERAFRALSVNARGEGPGPLFRAPVPETALPHFETPFSQAGFLDWGALVDQLQVYAPELSGLMADVDYSDMPQNPTAKQWEAYMEMKRREQEKKAAAAQKDVKQWMDVLRVPRAFYWSAKKGASSMRSRFVIEF